jgi:hypothetical protein
VYLPAFKRSKRKEPFSEDVVVVIDFAFSKSVMLADGIGFSEAESSSTPVTWKLPGAWALVLLIQRTKASRTISFDMVEVLDE